MNSFTTHDTLPMQAALDAAHVTLFGIERHIKGIGIFKVRKITITPVSEEMADVTTCWELTERESAGVVYGTGFMVIC